jgi:hypothetical protein
MDGFEINPHQISRCIDARARDVRNETGRPPERQFDEPFGHLVRVDGLERDARWNGNDWQSRQLVHHEQYEVVELGRPNRGAIWISAASQG